MRPFTVLHVCTGNIARSAMAECTMRDALRRAALDDEQCQIVSAGTWGHEGSPMEPFAREVLAAHAVDATGFAAHALAASDVVAADLVLTAEREHRAAVVHLDPSALRRAFTLKEFARLVTPPPAAWPQRLAAVEPESRAWRWREFVANVASGRGADGPAGADDDLADPYGARLAVYQARFAEIQQAVERVVGALGAAL